MRTGFELVEEEEADYFGNVACDSRNATIDIMISAMVDNEKKGAQDASRASVVDDSRIACVVVHVCRYPRLILR